MLRLKSLFLILFLSSSVYSIEVLITNSKINYKETIDIKKLSSKNVLSVRKFCIPITIKDLETNKYLAKRYLKKNTILCANDIEKYSKKSVLFNFGLIQIEKEGKIIFENDDYIKIKRSNGKIDKIYKDGRIQ